MSTSELKVLPQEATDSLIMNHIKKLLNVEYINKEDKLLTNYGLSSLRVLMLIQWIENTFSIRFDGQDLKRENFDSISAIISLVKSKKSIK